IIDRPSPPNDRPAVGADRSPRRWTAETTAPTVAPITAPADLDHREAGSAALERPTLPEVGIRSSRRFSFKAASSDPLVGGRSLPLLTVVIREVSIPRLSRYFLAASARRWPSARLYSREPRSSQLPSMRTD